MKSLFIAAVALGEAAFPEPSPPESAVEYFASLGSATPGEECPELPVLSKALSIAVTPETSAIAIPALEARFTTCVSRDERLYLGALLARFGAAGYASWLRREYERSGTSLPDISYAMRAFELLCMSGESDLEDLVVAEAIASPDPALKITAETCLREAGSPGALDIMRNWDSIENGDFDLIVAKHYLLAIVEFGDAQDLPFVDWLEGDASAYFPRVDIDAVLQPLILDARQSIGDRAARLRDPE